MDELIERVAQAINKGLGPDWHNRYRFDASTVWDEMPDEMRTDLRLAAQYAIAEISKAIQHE